MENSEEYQRIFTEYADRINYWSKMSGLNLKTTYDVYQLFNILMIEKEQNKRFVLCFHAKLIVFIHNKAYSFQKFIQSPKMG